MLTTASIASVLAMNLIGVGVEAVLELMNTNGALDYCDNLNTEYTMIKVHREYKILKFLML